MKPLHNNNNNYLRKKRNLKIFETEQEKKKIKID